MMDGGWLGESVWVLRWLHTLCWELFWLSFLSNWCWKDRKQVDIRACAGDMGMNTRYRWRAERGKKGGSGVRGEKR